LEIIEYLKTPPSESELENILNMLGKTPGELMRKGEAEFKKHIKDKVLPHAETIALMMKYPKVIERPVVAHGNKAAVGRPPESVLGIL
jgi:arsenate reductase